MTAMVLHPDTDQVAMAWIDTITGFPKGIVGPQLPTDQTTWSANGFVVVYGGVGGSPDPDIDLRKPVVQVECWATNPGSNKPPWGKAASLAGQIRVACYDKQTFGRELHIAVNGVTYPSATCKSVFMLTEPHRIYNDVGDYAGYSFDLQLAWVELTDR